MTRVTEIQIGLDGIVLAGSTQLAGARLSPPATSISRSPPRPSASRTGPRPGATSTAELPAIPIRVYGPPPTSGTRDAIAELLLTPPCEKNAGDGGDEEDQRGASSRRSAPSIREDGAYIEAGENDNLIVRKLGATPGAYGLFGYSFLEENSGTLRGVTINGVAPELRDASPISAIRALGRSTSTSRTARHGHSRHPPICRRIHPRDRPGARNGYLVRRGMIASPDPVRANYAQAARRSLRSRSPASNDPGGARVERPARRHQTAT